MESPRTTETVTLSARTIHNPAEPRHFMRLLPVKGGVEVRAGDQTLVSSHAAIRLVEVGKDVYEPAFYFPREDIKAPLSPVADKRTYCPLKGHADYFEIETSVGTVTAWSYAETLPFADELRDLIAFYPHSLTFVETRPAAST